MEVSVASLEMRLVQPVTVKKTSQALSGQRVLVGDHAAMTTSPQIKTFRRANLLYGEDLGIASPHWLVNQGDVVRRLNHLRIGLLSFIHLRGSRCLRAIFRGTKLESVYDVLRDHCIAAAPAREL